MALASKQRDALIAERGEPVLRLEFDVFPDGQVSMWSHFEHGSDFRHTKEMLVQIHDHLAEFLRDENMCPFHRDSDQYE